MSATFNAEGMLHILNVAAREQAIELIVLTEQPGSCPVMEFSRPIASIPTEVAEQILNSMSGIESTIVSVVH